MAKGLFGAVCLACTFDQSLERTEVGSKLRTNEGEEEVEGVNNETEAIRESSVQQSYSRLTAPAALVLIRAEFSVWILEPDVFDEGQLSTSEKTTSDSKGV